MKKYIAIIEIEDDEEIVDAKISYIYSNNGMNYKATERMELKEENKDARNKTYEDGLNEAWKAARKVLCDSGCNLVKLEDIFDSHTIDGIFNTYTASEVIERLEKYERFNVGDEVVDKNGWGIKGVITKISEWSISIVENEGSVSRLKKDEFNKTGRHFPQIEEMLKQMQEDENEDI
jgi:preprotein translocase subunit YajC